MLTTTSGAFRLDKSKFKGLHILCNIYTCKYGFFRSIIRLNMYVYALSISVWRPISSDYQYKHKLKDSVLAIC